MKKMDLMVSLLLIAFLAGTSFGTVGEVWDLADDMTENVLGNPAMPGGALTTTPINPNGTWTYGYVAVAEGTTPDTTVLGGTFSNVQNDFYVSGYVYKFDNGSAWLPLVGKNLSATQGGSTADWGPLMCYMHSDWDNQPVARWTAPENGLFDIEAWWGEGAGGAVDCFLMLNGTTALVDVKGATTAVSYSSTGSVAMSAGDTLDFLISDSGDIGADTTPIAFTITQVPEPATITLLGMGCIAMLRKRR